MKKYTFFGFVQTMNRTVRRIAVIRLVVAVSMFVPVTAQGQDGWSESDSLFGEVTHTVHFPPDVRCVINVPDGRHVRPGTPWLTIIYALPNGNSIEQTAGRIVRDGMDWHFGIQQIAAQVRLLRHLDTTRNYAVAYMEASSRSWPAWRQSHADASRRIHAMVDSVCRAIAPAGSDFVLSGHSGGGSFIFGYLNDTLAFSAGLQRIVFLDADYGFDPHAPTATRLCEWLGQNTLHALVVVAYDDRNIVLNGKRVVGPDGGTYRRTFEMAEFFIESGVDLRRTEDSVFIRWESQRPRISLWVHKNPANEILHTVLVERNGFLHGIGAFQDIPEIPALWQEPGYSKYIQP